MKYVIHNVKDSDWNIVGNKYLVFVTDPAISLTLTSKDFEVKKENDYTRKDFIEKKSFEAKRIDPEKFMENKDYLHKEALNEIFAWISNDIHNRGARESFTIESHIFI